MQPNVDRYTDAHVRATPALIDAAKAYVLSYAGDFPLIINCRERLRAGEPLNIAHARAILNAMRADPRVTTLPEPGAITRVAIDDSSRLARLLAMCLP